MNKIIPFLLICLVCLSGCTNPFEDQTPRQIQPLIITLASDLTTLKSGEETCLYLTFDNLDEKEEYEISGRIMDGGIFIVSDSFDDEELIGLQKKTLELEIGAPEVNADIPSRISAEVQVIKISNFHIPILFADREYEIEQEIAGQPIQKQPKTYSFSDRLVNVEIELNKNPPIDTGAAWGTIKLTPRRNGVLDFDSIYGDDIMCEEINEFTNTVSCTFSGDADQLEEMNFEMEIKYKYREIKYLDFMILKGEGEYIPSKPTTDTSRIGDESEFIFNVSPEIVYPTTSQVTLNFGFENENEAPLKIKNIEYSYPKEYLNQIMINTDCKGSYIYKGETKNCRIGLAIKNYPDSGTTAEVSATATYITTLEHDLAIGNSKGSRKIYDKWSPIILESEITDVSYEYDYCTYWVKDMKEPVIYKCPGGDKSECPSGCECIGEVCKRKKRIDNLLVDIYIKNNGIGSMTIKDLEIDGGECSECDAAGAIKCCKVVKDKREKIQISMEFQSSVTLKKKIEFSE
ncbi:MAG: hypothetical protein DRP06_01110 [Candidatus Aenigmatarchaeota archaeon]|nr:MAG: hypothetical protein DRP06_01110 [Candidatus Aenigmarchaeota archaeon]